MTKKSYRERARERRQHDILMTAARMIHKNGYSNLNMDLLAEEVGISKSTLYQHFRSKEDMIIAVLLRGFEDMEDHITTSEGEPIVRLEMLMRYMLIEGYAPDGFATAMVRDEVMALFHSHDDIRTYLHRLHGMITGMIDDAKSNGQILRDIPNQVIINAMFGLMSVMNDPVTHQYTPVQTNREQYAEHAIRLWLRGITPASHN